VHTIGQKDRNRTPVGIVSGIVADLISNSSAAHFVTQVIGFKYLFGEGWESDQRLAAHFYVDADFFEIFPPALLFHSAGLSLHILARGRSRRRSNGSVEDENEYGKRPKIFHLLTSYAFA